MLQFRNAITLSFSIWLTKALQVVTLIVMLRHCVCLSKMATDLSLLNHMLRTWVFMV